MKEQKLEGDLCARLPYGLKVSVAVKEDNGQETWLTGTLKAAERCGEKFAFTVCLIDETTGKEVDCYPLKARDIKPYLRHFDDMTNEEIASMLIIQMVSTQNKIEIMGELLRFCKINHVDYNGMIEDGQAIRVTDKNNPYNEKQNGR